MTLEEKLHKEFDWLFVKHVNPTNAIKEIVALHQQEIDEACKKQREICAKEYLRDKGYSDTTQSVISTIILNAPSPKESE